MRDTIESHLPFVWFFQNEVQKAFDYVDSTDFLNIEIPTFSFNLGAVNFTAEGQHVLNVRNAYEPYRIMVRSFLALIVYGLGGIYLVKYILNYGQTQSNSKVIEGQQSLFK